MKNIILNLPRNPVKKPNIRALDQITGICLHRIEVDLTDSGETTGYANNTIGITRFFVELHKWSDLNQKMPWATIPYHILINESQSYQCLRLTEMGNQAKGHNHELIGVGVIGDWRINPVPPLTIDEIVIVCSDLIEFLNKRNIHVGADRIFGHQDFVDPKIKVCPGEHLYKRLEEIRNRVKRRFPNGNDFVI